MKISHVFLLLFILSSSVLYAQTHKDFSPVKVSEQKEIKATNYLKKEIEQKQLTAPPERLADTAATSKNLNKKKKKKQSKASNKRDLKESNQQSE